MTPFLRQLALALVIVIVGIAGAAPDPTVARGPSQLAELIDRAILDRLSAEKITPSAPADDAEFLRRVYLDLTGKIPSADKALAFLDSKEPNKRVRLIDDLLDSKDYGRHFATIWRNLIIRPDANMIRPPATEPLVDWLAEQFNANKGWDKIVREMLTVEGSRPEGLFFLLNGDSRANPQANVIAGSVGQLFMGVQLACAECHNHPFVDKWKQEDFWGVAAFFGKVRGQGTPKAAFGGSNITEFARGKLDRRNMAPQMVGTSIVVPDSSFKQIGKRIPARVPHGEAAKLDASAAFRPALAKWLTAKENPYFATNAVNRLWAHFFGRGFANPVGETSEVNPPSHPELLSALAKAFGDGGFDQKHLIRGILWSKTYQRTSRPTPSSKGEDHLFARMNVKVITPEVLYDSLCQALGVNDLSAPLRAPAGKKAKAKAKAKANANFRVAQPGAKQQFLLLYTTRDAEGDATEYTHGIPQALRLMNHGLFNTGGATVDRVVRTGGDPEKIVEGLYLSVLSRRPDEAERKETLAFLAKQKAPEDGYRSVFWALLNSAEFMINR